VPRQLAAKNQKKKGEGKWGGWKPKGREHLASSCSINRDFLVENSACAALIPAAWGAWSWL